MHRNSDRRLLTFFVAGLQVNLYAMDVRTSGIYRFGIIDRVYLPASAKELPTYEAVHIMLRSLEVCCSFAPLLMYVFHHTYRI